MLEATIIIVDKRTYSSLASAGAFIDTDVGRGGSKNGSGSQRCRRSRAAVGIAILHEDRIASLGAGVQRGCLDLARKREDLTADNTIVWTLAVIAGAGSSIIELDT